MINYRKKCLNCNKVDLNKGKDPYCTETQDLCKNSYKNCSNPLKTCSLCNNYSNKKDNFCDIDGHFKSENTFRICKSYRDKNG